MPTKLKTIFPCWQNGEKSYTKGGRVQCDVCQSFMGLIARTSYKRGYPLLSRKCVNCGSKEQTNNHTGEILLQTIMLPKGVIEI